MHHLTYPTLLAKFSFFLASIVCFLLSTHSVMGQKEGNIWYFGESAGLDFNTNPPTPLTTGELNTIEGCASICNPTGELLFYTDGVTVWNKEHDFMDNGLGLLGHASATQSATIVPIPKDTTRYYIFTVVDGGGATGFRYSIVDLSLNNGLGKVTDKNVSLLTPVTEKVTAVKHRNNVDVWVITHEWNSDAFYVYLVTENGINTTPIISSVGEPHQSGFNTIGYLKASPIGDKIACAMRDKFYQILDFDNTTGVISNPLTIPQFEPFPYGVEFSPDGTKIYLSTWTQQNTDIYQYDLTAGTSTDILNSGIIVGSPSTCMANNAVVGALQLAPNGKLYIARNFCEYLDVINKPNKAGINCNYVEQGIHLGGRLSRLGLPTFIQSFFNVVEFSVMDTCFGSTTSFTIGESGSNTQIDAAIWNFGDPTTGALNESTDISPTHVFSSAGNYIVEVTAFQNGISTVATDTITIVPATFLDLGADTNICLGGSLTLAADLLTNSTTIQNYTWSDNSSNNTLVINTPDTYSLTIEDACGVSQDEITIGQLPELTISLPNDTLLCTNSNLVLEPVTNNDIISYRWHDGSNNPTFSVTNSGWHWVEVSDVCVTRRDSILITYEISLSTNLPTDTLLCENATLSLAPMITTMNNDALTYLWSDGSINTSFSTQNEGWHWLEVSNGCTTIRDSIFLTWIMPLQVNIGKDTIGCQGESLLLDVTLANNYTTYLWSDGSTNPTLTVDNSGDYTVTLENNCEIISHTITVNLLAPITADLGADTFLCEEETLLLSPNNNNNEEVIKYRWQDGSTDSIFIASSPNTYWVEVTDACTSIIDSIVLKPAEPNFEKINLGNDTTLCNQETLVLSAVVDGPGVFDYIWQDGSTDSTFLANQPGVYTVQVSDGCTSHKDTLTLIPIDCSCKFLVPTAFSPNGDGVNDVLKVLHNCEIIAFQFRIFNRWGQEVFATNDEYFQWTGDCNRRVCATGAYTWTITYTQQVQNNPVVTTISGAIVLLR